MSDALHVVTDDGSYGRRGNVCTPLSEMLAAGKKFDKVEALFNLNAANGEFVAAGMGSVDTKKALVKSISGNVVGAIAAPECEDECKDYDNDLRFGSVCEDAEIVDGANTVAYGSWSLKYNSSLSKKLLKNSINSLLPKGVVACE